MQRALQEGALHICKARSTAFLFNTLSTIAALSREEGAPLSEDLIIRLSNFLPLLARRATKTMVSLGREVELLQTTSNCRKRGTAAVSTQKSSIEPGLERVTVPKFILQPLVENSMLHGLKECISERRDPRPGAASGSGCRHHRDG